MHNLEQTFHGSWVEWNSSSAGARVGTSVLGFLRKKGLILDYIICDNTVVGIILPVMPYPSWSVLGPGEVGGVGGHPAAGDTPALSSSKGPCWRQGLASPWTHPGQPCPCCFWITVIQMSSAFTSKSLQLQAIEVYIFLN